MTESGFGVDFFLVTFRWARSNLTSFLSILVPWCWFQCQQGLKQRKIADSEFVVFSFFLYFKPKCSGTLLNMATIWPQNPDLTNEFLRLKGVSYQKWRDFSCQSKPAVIKKWPYYKVVVMKRWLFQRGDRDQHSPRYFSRPTDALVLHWHFQS